MRSLCAFPGCKSGSANEKKYNKLHGQRNKTMFKFPDADKFPFIRQKWEEYIGRKAKETDVLCELHFSAHDVQRNYQTLLSNEILHTMERGRITLKPKAIPRNETCNKENSEPRNAALNMCPSQINSAPKKLEHLQILQQSKEGLNTCLSLSSTSTSSISSKNLENIENHISMDTGENCPPNQCDNVDFTKDSVDNNSKCKSTFAISTCAIETEESILVANEIPTPCSKNDKSKLSPLKSLHRELKRMKLPHGWSYVKLTHGDGAILVGLFSNNQPAQKEFVIYADGSVQVFMQKKSVYVPGIKIGPTTENVLHNIEILQSLLLCNGTNTEQRHSNFCKGFRTPTQSHFKSGHIKCSACKELQAKISRRERAQAAQRKKAQTKSKKRKEQLKGAKKVNQRLRTKVDKSKVEIAGLRKKCAETKEATIKQAIATLPEEQQEMVKTCFDSAKVKSKGQRYSKEWVYECMLMRIKSKKLYDHLKSHKILPLPDVSTLNKWLKGMGSTYGFNSTTFQMLKEKSKEIQPAERRGILLVDEMKLSEAIKLNRNSMQFDGFVNLGDYTPNHQKDEMGDHALVLMFQPFRGSEVQALACFLSKGCADSNVLHYLLLECIILLEEAGFLVDGVTTDGASWNRSMWKKFGISENKISCKHPCDPERQLWFFSDFPHLIKTFRNAIIKEHETWTPDGVVKRKHWEAILECESDPYQLKIAHKLTRNHLNPQYYQKMNVPLAFQLFDERVAVAMDIYRNEHSDLADCESTIRFIRRMNKLIEIMMSRTPLNALRPNSSEKTALVEFLEYLHEWQVSANTNGYKFLTDSTSYGLTITLRATLEILQFLTFDCNYEYLMTARLNQDALERFFGLARGVCGSNDHPDAILFGQMFRLMSTYSLIKPRKGSNVSGGEKLNSLISLSNIPASHSGRMEWTKVMDSIIERGDPEKILNQSNFEGTENEGVKEDSRIFLIEYMAGYIVRNHRRWTKCDDCIRNITADPNHKNHKMITLLNRGSLSEPSIDLIRLVDCMEKIILDVVNTQSINADTVFHISYAFQEVRDKLPLIGCLLHQEDLTTSVLSFYVMIRAEFLAKQHNIRHCQTQKQKTRQARKNAKL